MTDTCDDWGLLIQADLDGELDIATIARLARHIETCPACESTDVVGETRVVGYFSKIQNWNKSKRYGELKARQNGRYGIEEASVCPENETVAVKR